MKLTTPAIVLCLLFSLMPSLQAQEKSFDPLGHEAEASLPRQVRVQVEYIELSLEETSALMADSKASKSDIVLREHVTALIKAKKAKIIASQMLVARSGEKATSESIREFIYPTEYEPANLPEKVTFEKGTESKTTLKDLATPPTPTAFEARNLGATLEVEPTIGEGNRTIDLRLAPEIVYHVENTKWTTWKDKNGEANIMMPVMYTLRVTTAVAVANGKTSFLAALSPKDDKGVTDFSRKILVFVKCDIVFAGR